VREGGGESGWVGDWKRIINQIKHNALPSGKSTKSEEASR